jgi:hypothetical protein
VRCCRVQPPLAAAVRRRLHLPPGCLPMCAMFGALALSPAVCLLACALAQSGCVILRPTCPGAGVIVVMEASLATTACRLPLQACLAALPAGLQAWVWDVRSRRPLDPVVWRCSLCC